MANQQGLGIGGLGGFRIAGGGCGRLAVGDDLPKGDHQPDAQPTIPREVVLIWWTRGGLGARKRKWLNKPRRARRGFDEAFKRDSVVAEALAKIQETAVAVEINLREH